MLETRISRALLLLGAAVGLMGVGVWTLELRLNLPDWIVRVAMIKLAFVAAAGLLAAGAVVGRHAKTRSLTGSSLVPRLGEGDAEPLEQSQSSAVPQEIERNSGTPP